MERFCDLHGLRVLKVNSDRDLNKDPALGYYLPKVVLVYHSNIEGTDVILTNLSIQHAYLFISLKKLIKWHIDQQTDIGRKLLQSVNKTHLQEEIKEHECKPELFNPILVIEMLKKKITEIRKHERVIIVEGLLQGEFQEKGAFFYMEQLAAAEKRIGDILSLIVMQPDVTNIQEEDFHFQEIAKQEESADGFQIKGHSWPNSPTSLLQLFYNYRKCQISEIQRHLSKNYSELDKVLQRIGEGDLSEKPSLIQIVDP